MHLYNGTGCLVFLVGSVTMMPVVAKKNSDAMIIVSRKRHHDENTVDKIEHYRVILNQDDTYRIMTFGFPGMTISVRGDFCSENNAEIIAEKIDFIDFSNSNAFESLSANEMNNTNFFNTEMSYWFARDGSMRKELMAVH
ncbi:MAG TPA: hypothetical protein VJK30_06555 [Coxiellaceae bacterium]|nr:MAG: hypothetical protein A3E81_05655 [Gammaproteobacteria bacterium RIFCSPHIGHO2_12_FULL_36_30]HLB56969.1 hypothetical protein [Coxiellaceae bacterium]